MVYTYKRGLSSEQDLVDGSPSRSEDMANKIECYIFGILLQLSNGITEPDKKNCIRLSSFKKKICNFFRATVKIQHPDLRGTKIK